MDEEYNEELAGDKIKEKHQGICPDGWHIPSIDDWEELKTFVGENNDGEDDISPIRADLRYDVGELRYLQSERYSRKYYVSVRCLKD